MSILEEGKRAALITIAAVFLRAVLQGVTGYFIGSAALMTAAFESLSDVLTSASSWLGLKIAQKKPDEKFPYGYYKAETIASLLVSLVIAYAAFQFFIEGYTRLLHPVLLSGITEGIVIALASVVISFWLYKFLSGVAKRTNSQAIKANADDKMTDVLSSLLVLVAVASSLISAPWLEGAVTILISALVLKLAFENMRDSLFALMDVSPSKEDEAKLEKIFSSEKEVRRFKGLKLRKAGPFIFGEVKIEVVGSIDVKRAHAITNRIEEHASKKIKELMGLTVHVEPFRPETTTLAIPLAENKGLESKVLGHVGRAKYFLLATVSGGKIMHNKVVKNPYASEKSRTGLRAANLLADNGADAVVVKSIGEISFHTLRDKFVEVYKAKGNTAGEVTKRFIAGKLELLTEPTKESGRARQ